ncbi:MAG: hypothetical protein HZA95_00715 [Candidatus Vogelbacteria bacterium]|nr:hypothetical protein [Candidatus Vogelbacteria bacterium]
MLNGEPWWLQPIPNHTSVQLATDMESDFIDVVANRGYSLRIAPMPQRSKEIDHYIVTIDVSGSIGLTDKIRFVAKPNKSSFVISAYDPRCDRSMHAVKRGYKRLLAQFIEHILPVPDED